MCTRVSPSAFNMLKRKPNDSFSVIFCNTLNPDTHVLHYQLRESISSSPSTVKRMYEEQLQRKARQCCLHVTVL